VLNDPVNVLDVVIITTLAKLVDQIEDLRLQTQVQ
jgi:hypothetical protein